MSAGSLRTRHWRVFDMHGKQAAASAGSGAQQRVNLSEIGHSEIEHLKRAALRSGPFLLDFKGMKTTASPSGEQAIEHRRP